MGFCSATLVKNAAPLVLIISCFNSLFALEPLSIYSDEGCSAGSVSASWASVSATAGVCAPGNKVAVTCTTKCSGTDAIELCFPNNLGWYNFGLAFADWAPRNFAGYVDVRFCARNVLTTQARFAMHFVNSTDQSSADVNVNIPASSAWTEYVFPLSGFGAVAQGSVKNLVLINQSGAPTIMHAFIDNIRLTDGVNTGTVDIPAAPGGNAPATWPAHLAVGVSDNTIGEGSTMPVNRIDYRMHYLTWGWQDAGNWGNYITRFIADSKTLGTKSAFVWYWMSKMETGQKEKTYLRLNKLDTMTIYFNAYETALTEMAAGNQAGIAIILEPDMYGYILGVADSLGVAYANIPVRMDRANAIAGSSYPNTLAGFCQYMVQRAKTKLPQGVVVGHMLSHWYPMIQGQLGWGSINAHLSAGLAQAAFLNSLGPNGKGDVFFVEKTDRDAGQKAAAGDNSWFWTKDNYDKLFAWAKMISNRSGLRACGWQVSEGNMNHSNTQYRDDAPQYFVSNCADWVNAGFIGVLFGGGGGASYQNDNNWFVNTMTTYHANPCQLSVPVENPVIESIKKSPSMTLAMKGDRVIVSVQDPSSSIRVYSAGGRKVFSQSAARAGMVFIDGLSQGTYFLECKNAGGTTRSVMFIK